MRQFKTLSFTLVLALAALAACSGGESARTDTGGEMAAANPCAANPCAANPCAANPCAANPCAPAMQEGMSAELISQGKEVYANAGLCHACHGPDGKGMPGLGADLTDDEWAHSDGSLEGIGNSVTDGVTSEASSTGTPMPPRGGSGITDEQVKAVAAYVYSLSH